MANWQEEKPKDIKANLKKNLNLTLYLILNQPNYKLYSVSIN